MRSEMGAKSNGESNATGAENPWPWIAGAAALIGWAAWADRNSWYAKLAPYGLTTEETRTSYNGYGGGYGADPFGRQLAPASYGTGQFHINPVGWVTIGIVAVGLVAVLWCVVAGVGVVRWHAARGTGAIPKIPVPAAAVVVAVAVFVTVLALIGRQSNPGVRALVFIGAAALGVVAWFVVMVYAMLPAEHWRLAQAFAGRAEQVLGHGHPGVGRVKVCGWHAELVEDRARYWPVKLVAAAGPGWQHKPSELDELNRYAREFGWPPYEWRYDPMRKHVTGTARPDVETLFR